MLFHRYLSERFGDGSPRLFGEALLEFTSGSDFFEVWSIPMQEQGETFESAMREFGWWRWVTPQLTSEHPWNSLGEPWPSETSIDPETLSFGEDFSGSLEPGGSTYRRVFPVLVAGSLTASLAPGPDLWLSAVRLASDGSWILDEANEQGLLELPLSPSVDVILIVTYAKATFDFDDFLVDQPNAGQYSVTIEQD